VIQAIRVFKGFRERKVTREMLVIKGFRESKESKAKLGK
jgi:hypothetical protein